MEYTTHYNLNKPDPNDTYNKANDNSNMDAIDAQMYANAQAAANAQTTANAAIPSSQKGAANGVAPLGADGQIAATYLGHATVNVASGSGTGTVELPQSAGTPATPVVPYRAARVQDYELTDTNLDTVMTYTPPASGNFSAKIYVRVVTAATNVDIEVTYTDATGAQTYTVVNQSLATGEYMFPAPFFNSLANDAISVKAQAGTANQVYVSASLIGE